MNIQKLNGCLKEYIWGSENWMLHGQSEALSLVQTGETCDQFSAFPQLIKWIKAEDTLSVQVHPDDHFALQHENSFGKTEMWYIVDAQPGASILLGFKNDVTEQQVRDGIEDGSLVSLLRKVPVKKGDFFFIPAGTVHAIGKGCTICEIQQNSNLTYRLFDYHRLDKQGNPRPLHIEKAFQVMNRKRFAPITPSGTVLAAGKYFLVEKHRVQGRDTIPCHPHSFTCVVCVDGTGTIDGHSIVCGDGYLAGAQTGELRINGDLTVLVSQVRKLSMGIDLGGTFIKGGIVDDLGNLIVSEKVPTQVERGEEAVADTIVALFHSLCKRVGITADDIDGVGMGIPGTIDSKSGTVVYSNNLKWENVPLANMVQEKIGVPVKTSNDANAATLGEFLYGSAKSFASCVMLTLGTGVGSGIILNGTLYEGNCSAGAELGHMVIQVGGKPCTCGRKGCLETYASASALIELTKEMMQQHPESLLCAETADKVDGSTAFRCAHTDKVAKDIVETYLAALGCGLLNIANALRPDAIVLGGGISYHLDPYIPHLQQMVNEQCFGSNRGPKVSIAVASLKNEAGILGASALIK